MTEQANIPKPASPLPWRACDDQTDTYPHVEDVNGDPVTEFNGCDWGDFEDCCYIAWAANNAQALAARVERLEAALRARLADHEDQAEWWASIKDHENSEYHTSAAADIRKALEAKA